MGRRQRHSDLVDHSAAELADILKRDKQLTRSERQKLVAELKFWKERNRQKRSK
jgi:hypothetical protein